MWLANSGQVSANSGSSPLAQALLQLGAELLVVPVAAGEADDGEIGGEVPSDPPGDTARGTSLRWVRSPVAPNRTTAQGSGTRVLGRFCRNGLASATANDSFIPGLPAGREVPRLWPEDVRADLEEFRGAIPHNQEHHP